MSRSTLPATIRRETRADTAPIRHVNEAAFGRAEEANLVDALRDGGQSTLSLVAEENGEIVGHIFFCRVHINTSDRVLDAVSLSPMAVLPEFQNRGIGSQLVKHGLTVLRAQNETIVTVLGHPGFYPRFGFVSAHQFNMACPYEVSPEAWMLLELQAGVVRGISGIVVYPRAFENV